MLGEVIVGGMNRTIENVTVNGGEVPALLVAVNWQTNVPTAARVPLITPVEVLKLNPVGSVPETNAYEVG